MGWYEREILVYHHKINHCSSKYLIRLPKRGITTRKLIKTRKLPPLCCVHIRNVPKEAMEDQIQTAKRINKEALGYQTRGNDLN